MNKRSPEDVKQLNEALLAEYHALQLQRQFRHKQPATDRDTLDRMLWPIELTASELDRLLDRAEDIAYDFRIDVLDVLAVVLAHSTPSERQRIHQESDEVQLLTLRFGRLRQLLGALEGHVDVLEAEIRENLRRQHISWHPQTWSGQQLLDMIQIRAVHWPRLLRSRHYRVPQLTNAKARESAHLDRHAGAVWLRQLLPKAEIAEHEVEPLLTHLGLWSLRVQALPVKPEAGRPETARDAAKRILRHLRDIQNEDDGWQIELMRTDRASRLYTHPLLKAPPQEDW